MVASSLGQVALLHSLPLRQKSLKDMYHVHPSVPPYSPRSGVTEPFRKNDTVLLRTVLHTGCCRLHFNTVAPDWLRSLQMSLQNLEPPVGLISHFAHRLLLLFDVKTSAQWRTCYSKIATHERSLSCAKMAGHAVSRLHTCTHVKLASPSWQLVMSCMATALTNYGMIVEHATGTFITYI